ncbi:MAG: hypothetical protein KDD51_06370 [Bdellovibrionales bacterium]|nr:hypothetical protein [Bdellovibrionales bacterium]
MKTYRTSFLWSVLLALYLASDFAFAELPPRGPGRSLLWAYYDNYAACYRWVAAYGGGNGNLHTVEEAEDAGGCREDPRRDTDVCRFSFQQAVDGLCPTYYFQSANIHPSKRRRPRNRATFDFDIRPRAGIPTFRLHNDGRGDRDLAESCRRQSELSVSFFEAPLSSQFVTDRNGEPYRLQDYTALHLTFEARVVTRKSKCAKASDQIAIFKPSVLVDYYDNTGTLVGMNALIFNLAPIGGTYHGPGEVFPPLPEVRLYDKDCQHNEFDRSVCTVHSDTSVMKVTPIGYSGAYQADKWNRYQVDLIPLFKRYGAIRHYKGATYQLMRPHGGVPIMKGQLRALQFIATQQGGLSSAFVRNINMRGARNLPSPNSP